MNNIELAQVYSEVGFPVVQRPAYVNAGGSTIKTGSSAIVRTDTNKVLSVMGSRYELIPHTEMIGRAVAEIEETGLEFYINKFHSMNDGAKVSLEFRFPTLRTKLGDGDEIDMQLHFKNSYDGSWSYDFMVGFFRLVCSNGLVVGKELARFKRKHTDGLRVAAGHSDLRRMLTLSQEYSVERFVQLKEAKITTKQGMNYIEESVKERVWPKKYQAQTETNFRERRGAFSNDNVFDLYNSYSRTLEDASEGKVILTGGENAKKLNYVRHQELNEKIYTYCNSLAA